MSQRQANLGRSPGPGGAERRRRARVPARITGLLLMLLSAGWAASLLAGVPAVAWLADAVSPPAVAQSVPPASSPSKEYVYAGGRLVATEEPSDDAAFVDQSVPTSMVAGQSYAVWVKMRNKGTSIWAAATGHKLGWQDTQNNTWGVSRVDLPSSVLPDGEVTFNFNVTAPAAPGTYNFQWSMVRDGVAWFGALSAPKSITVTAPATGSLSGTFAAQTAAVNLSTEGTQDWAHWGLTAAGSFDYKAGVAGRPITNYTILGTGTANRFGDLSYAHAWSDGTPTPSATTGTGVFVSGAEGNGFRITAPADTTTRTLRLYVGAWYAQGQLQAQLSDGSAAAYTNVSVNAIAGTSNYVHTITYKAASAGHTLTLSYTIRVNYNAPYGNITLQAATLAPGAPPPLPATDSAFVSQSVPTSMVAGQPYRVSITMRNTGANIWLANASPRLGSQNPQDNMTWGKHRVELSTFAISGAEATLNFTVTAPAAPGTYNFQWRMVQDDWFGAYTPNVPITVSAPGIGGTLGGSVTAAPAGSTVGLTAEGTQDWAHWGLTAAGSFDYKAGVVGRPITNYTVLGASAAARFADLSYAHAWTDGAPTPSATTNTGVFVSGAEGNGFRITAPADTTTRTLRLYVGAWYADGQLQAQLSDGSAAVYTDASVSAVTGTSNYVYTINYKASAAAQTLFITYTLKLNRHPPYGNVTLQAATLAEAPPPPNAMTSENMPTGLVATATSATTVGLTWAAAPGSVSGYVVERAQKAGAFAALTPGPTTTSFVDTTAAPDTAYLYRVKAVFAGGGTSGYSNQDVATTVVFTDGNPLPPGVLIRARHLNELRRGVNAVRALVGGLGPAAYTHLDPASDPPAQRRRIYLADVTELRARLDEALGPLGLLKPYPAEPALALGAPVRAAHFEQIRERVR